MNDDTLERLLDASARSLDYPSTPDLTARVLSRIAAPAARSGPLPVLRPAFLLVALLLLLVAALAIGPSRDAIARLFGVEGLRIERLETPVPAAASDATPVPTFAPGVPSTLLAQIPLSDVTRLTGTAPVLPRTSEALQGVFYVNCCQPGAVVYRYASFDLWQTTLKQESGFLKGVPGSAILEEVAVNGRPAVWIAGDSHVVYILDAAGRSVSGATWLVERNTLVWRGAELFYRIETDLSLEEAMRLAETLP